MPKILHGHMVDRIHGISGVTPFASMPQAPLNFTNSVRLNVEAIDKVLANTLLSVIAGVANGNIIALSDPGQHLQGDDRLFVFRLVSARRNDGDGVLSWRNVLRKTRLQAEAMVRQEAKGSTSVI